MLALQGLLACDLIDLRGRWKGGTHLGKTEIAAELGMSRAPVARLSGGLRQKRRWNDPHTACASVHDPR